MASTSVSQYDIGDVVRLTGTFRSTAGVLTDPTKVTIKYEDPSANVVTITSTAGSVFHPSTGVFYTDVVIDEAGVWEYRIYSTGLITSSTEDWFRVRTPRIP